MAYVSTKYQIWNNALARLPDLESRGPAVVAVKCARSSSIDPNTAVFAYRALGSLLGYLWPVSDRFDLLDRPRRALTR